MSGMGPGCVKTRTSRECAELFSLFSSFDGDCQNGSFVIRRSRDNFYTQVRRRSFHTAWVKSTVLTLCHSRQVYSENQTRSNPEQSKKTGLLRRCAPRNDDCPALDTNHNQSWGVNFINPWALADVRFRSVGIPFITRDKRKPPAKRGRRFFKLIIAVCGCTLSRIGQVYFDITS